MKLLQSHVHPLHVLDEESEDLVAVGSMSGPHARAARQGNPGTEVLHGARQLLDRTPRPP